MSYEIVTALLKRGVILWNMLIFGTQQQLHQLPVKQQNICVLTRYQISYPTWLINDEYNMLYNSAKMLTSGPRLLYHSSIQIAKNIAVVGSGLA